MDKQRKNVSHIKTIVPSGNFRSIFFFFLDEKQIFYILSYNKKC